LLVIVFKLATKTLVIVDLVLEVEGIVFKLVSGLNLLTGSLVFLSVLFGLLNHAVNFFLSKAALVIGDGDLNDLH
jgi:hypothetical protein